MRYVKTPMRFEVSQSLEISWANLCEAFLYEATSPDRFIGDSIHSGSILGDLGTSAMLF